MTQPFFPGYLLVRLDLNTGALSQVHWTPGLKYVVSFDDRPAVVPDEVIALIQERLATIEATGGLAGRCFHPGDRVHIHSGPFADFEAVFEEELKPAERAWVLVRFLDRVNRVPVAVKDLESVESDTASSVQKKGRRTRGRGRRIREQRSQGAEE